MLLYTGNEEHESLRYFINYTRNNTAVYRTAPRYTAVQSEFRECANKSANPITITFVLAKILRPFCLR